MPARVPVEIGRLIVTQPDIRGGRPCLAGTGMTVHAVAARHLRGMSAQDILDEFPDLDLSRIHAALAYYFANQTEIEEDLESERRLGDELAARYPHGWTSETERR
jgi:uncharacterized protein (DUF433 family)